MLNFVDYAQMMLRDSIPAYTLLPLIGNHLESGEYSKDWNRVGEGLQLFPAMLTCASVAMSCGIGSDAALLSVVSPVILTFSVLHGVENYAEKGLDVGLFLKANEYRRHFMIAMKVVGLAVAILGFITLLMDGAIFSTLLISASLVVNFTSIVNSWKESQRGVLRIN